ncbi:hypothetical protein Tco_0514649 [Tanacetum coccineum]
MARVHEVAQSFTEEEWENIRARVEADEELAQRLQAEERNNHRSALGMERDCQHGLYKAGWRKSSRVLSDFAGEVWEQNRVLAGFGIGGRLGKGFIQEEWENIRARVEADEELTQRLQAEERNKYSEVDQAKMLVDLINQRKRYFTTQKTEAKRNKPMTQVLKSRFRILFNFGFIQAVKMTVSNMCFADVMHVTPPKWATVKYDVLGVLLHRSMAQDMRTTSIGVV